MNTNYRSIIINWLSQGFSAVFILAFVTSVLAQTPALRANGRIAFTSDRDGNHEIYVMNADGSNQVRVTHNPGVDEYPTWSPDGTKIAFVSQRPSGGYAIHTMNTDGTNKIEVTPINLYYPSSPSWYSDFWSMSWSPDGNRIALQDNWDIFVVNADGSNRKRLTDASGYDHEPSWSPDGSRILFASTRGWKLYPSMYTIKPDGTGLQAFPGFVVGYWEIAPNWSPTGDKALFVRDGSDDISSNSDIVIANADGTNRQLFDGGETEYVYRNKPSWSPDGSKIIFDKWEYSTGDMEIYVKNTDGSGFAQLTNNTSGWNFHPSWQPLAAVTCSNPNPIDCTDFFIRQQYLDFFGREPDSDGLANWMATLGGCPNGGFGEVDNPYCDRVHVSAGFVQSHEFQGRGYWILRFGYVGLNRSIGSVRSSATYAEFTPALAQVGGSNSPVQEETAKVAYANAFIQRQDFLALFPTTLTASQYVNALESNAQVTIPNKQALVDALNAGTMTRAEVLRSVVESQVVFDKFIIPGFVTMQYFGYLHRDPDTIGYQNWVETLTANPSDFRHMIFGFIYSTEYRQRFGPT